MYMCSFSTARDNSFNRGINRLCGTNQMYYLRKIQIAAALNKKQLIISDCKWAVAWQSFWILSDIYTCCPVTI